MRRIKVGASILRNIRAAWIMRGLVALLGGAFTVVVLSTPVNAQFVWGNGACWTTSWVLTNGTFSPVFSISRSHSHTTSTSGGLFDNGLLISQVPGVGACYYNLTPAGSTFTLKSDGSGTNTINWSALSTNPAGCGPSFTSHGAVIAQANGGSVGTGTDASGDTAVTKCDPQ